MFHSHVINWDVPTVPGILHFSRTAGGDGRDWKQGVVAHYKDVGYRTVCIGDGLSDRGAITAADIAFVKKGSELESWCDQQGIARQRFESFKDLLVELQRFRNVDQDE
jgi:2-hydroxy-3-keto-5-methylthiopentenyl-1-phosphate phosphatase